MDCPYDVVVVGGGIAGTSVAAELSAECSVLLLEMEERLGYHATGRSAALFILSYGNDDVRALTRASRQFLFQPPSWFCETPLVKPRSVLLTAGLGRETTFNAVLSNLVPEDEFTPKTTQEAACLCPILKAAALSRAAFSNRLADIEVHELHQGYVRTLKRYGGDILTDTMVTELTRDAGKWRITTTKETVTASIVVNAAGAWAGEIARIAGAQDVGLQPLRRTVCLIEPPAGSHTEAWPMLTDASEQFYLKPEAGILLLSPADETPSIPIDAQPEELDVAIAIERIEEVTTLAVKRIARKWAGLRSFVPGRSPVIGFDALQPGFFWHAAFGGFGIQTAPAASRLAASMLLGRPPADDLKAGGVDTAAVSPQRLRRG